MESKFNSANHAFDGRDFTNAIELLKHILPCSPEKERYRYIRFMSMAYLERGKAALEKGDTDSAISDFYQSLDITPNSAKALYYRGISYCRINDVNSQQDIITSLLMTGFIDAPPGWDKREHKKYQDAYFDQYVSECEQAIEMNKDDAEAYFNIGVAYHNKGKYSLAEKYYLKALEKNPKFADAYFNLGDVALTVDCYDKAIRNYAEAANIDKNDSAALSDLGNAYYMSGILLLSMGLDEGVADIFKKAIDSYSKALAIDPGQFNTRLYRGKSLFHLGLYDEAINDYIKVINTVPQYNEAYFSRGNAFFYKGDFEKAIDDYTEAIHLNDVPYPFKYRISRGDAYIRKGDAAAAIEDYTKAIEDTFPELFQSYPNYSEAYRKRGIAYRELGEPQKSIDDLKKYIEYNPYCDDRETIERTMLDMTR